MKKLIFMATMLLGSFLNVNAQDNVNVNNNMEKAPAVETVQTQKSMANILPAWVELSSANSKSIAEKTSEEREEAYNHGKVLKYVGMGITGAGATVTLIALAARHESNENDDIAEGIFSTTAVVYAGAATVTGIVLWAIGAHKMHVNKVGINQAGNLAYTF